MRDIIATLLVNLLALYAFNEYWKAFRGRGSRRID